MDTIFVKQVKPGSAADRAGLCTGDRVVSVNGETISGHSYASVVHRIHNSGHCLHLLVVPQDHDILQLYFNETAHRPESNLCGGGMVRPAPRRVSDTCAEPTDLYAQGCRLSLDAGLISRGEEATSQSSVSSSDDSIIISRIRRSCEQKEEFLRRPAAPLWPAPGAHGQATGPKEFYGRPQKLQPPPHWPPAIPASPLEREGTPPRERGFVYGGPVTNAARLRPGFNNALSRIQESPPSGPHHHPPPQIQVVSARARQFESGAPAPDRTSLYRSELARLSHKRMVPDVSVRARQYESQAEYHNRETRSLDSTGSLSPVGGLSGNRLVPVGGRNIHCEPPHSLDDNLRPRSNSAESAWLEEDVSWPMTRNRAVRQDSYLAACHKPSLAQAAAVPGLVEEQTCHANDTSPLPFPSPPPPAPEIRVEPAPRPARPVTLDLRSCDDLGTAEDSNCSPLGSPAVPWRDKTPNDIGSEEDRSTRRVSYLKATWPDRMNVDSDPDADQDVSDSEPPIRGARHSLCEELSQPDKENQQVTEGLLHCKLTLVDGKRAGDRSWKQVWAVLRGPILSLYKERRDSLPLTETVPVAVAVEGSEVDVRCATVSAAEDYTKRRHVLRLQTPAGSQLLLQAADQADMARWIDRLSQQANNTQDVTNNEDSQSPGSRKLSSLRNRSPTGQSPVTKTRKPSQQVVEPVSSPKSKTWKGRVAKQFRRIQQSGSPVSPTAPHPGPPPEGTTIGVPLEDCPPSLGNKYVPRLVEMCTAIVEERGLEIIGIYRVPGNTAAVSSLTEEVNRGLEEALQDRDVNVISSLLKSFFRRLPDALLTTELYPSFINADKIPDPRLRINTIRKLVHELPEHHYETLRYLLLHLKKVVEHSSMNKMEARNLAIVFGPTLVRTADDNMVTMVTDMSHQCRIVETLILHVDWCFGDEAVDRLSLEGVNGVGTEPEPAVANHNLLLSNIHKVEGMTKELSARDIVSSIICAANRKITKTKGRKPVGCSSATGEDLTDNPQRDGKTKVQHRKERLASTSEMSDPASPPTSRPDNVAVVGREADPETDAALDMTAQHPHLVTYAGLSDTTRERIRRFELETKAMLHRDPNRTRRLEPELNKRELEVDDHANPSAIIKKIAEGGRPSRPLAIVPPSVEGRVRRGSSVENLNQPLPDTANLKRFKSGKEQGGESNLARCGSLDSLHDVTPVERPPSNTSDEGGDLLVSLTSTFDAKLRSLLSNGGTDAPDAAAVTTTGPLFTDPSLHKACDKEGKESESKEECCGEKEKCESSNLLKQVGEIRAVRLYRSESMNRDERPSVNRSESLKLRRSESLNKENTKLKRSDSLTKNEKTESNLNKRRQLEAGRWNMVKLKRKTGSALDRSIKRRHTVGGTKDFDKVNWLDNRQREAEEESRKERRTSSPDLSCSRLAASVLLRPHSIAEPNLPLESHV